MDIGEFLFVFVGDGAARRGLARQAAVRGLDNVRFIAHRDEDTAMRLRGEALRMRLVPLLTTTAMLAGMATFAPSAGAAGGPAGSPASDCRAHVAGTLRQYASLVFVVSTLFFSWLLALSEADIRPMIRFESGCRQLLRRSMSCVER